MEIRIASRFNLVKKIGGGAFGQIYSGVDIVTNSKVAIKLVSISSLNDSSVQKEHMSVKFPQVLFEAKILRLMQGDEGIPTLYWAGQEGEFNIMVTELLGPSLEDMFNYCGDKLTLKTTILLAKQILSRLEHFHARQFLHRDIKPENFILGTGSKSDTVYLIDFGLSKRYIDPKNGQHIPFREGKALTGTARYSSLNTHLGYEQARRDDVEAVMYVLLYFVKGMLPWQGVGGVTKQEKYTNILRMKRDMPIEMIAHEMPIEFEDMIKYARALRYQDKPDYGYLRRMLDAVFFRANFIDLEFDWKLMNKQELLKVQKEQETRFLDTEKQNRRKRFGHHEKLTLPDITMGRGPNKYKGINEYDSLRGDSLLDEEYSNRDQEEAEDEEEEGEYEYEEEDEENKSGQKFRQSKKPQNSKRYQQDLPVKLSAVSVRPIQPSNVSKNKEPLDKKISKKVSLFEDVPSVNRQVTPLPLKQYDKLPQLSVNNSVVPQKPPQTYQELMSKQLQSKVQPRIQTKPSTQLQSQISIPKDKYQSQPSKIESQQPKRQQQQLSNINENGENDDDDDGEEMEEDEGGDNDDENFSEYNKQRETVQPTQKQVPQTNGKSKR